MLGEDKPEKVMTVPGGRESAWADAGNVHLDPGAYSATVLLPKGSTLEYVELAPPCLNPIEPVGGWKATALATTGDVAVSVLKALDLEHELPPSDTAIEVDAENIRPEGAMALEASHGPVPGLAGVWLRAGPKGVDASVFLDLPESGLYAVSVFGATGGGMRFTADACRKSVLCPEPAAEQGARWRQVFSGQFAASRHFLTLNLGRGAAVQRIRVERKKEAVVDYIATVRRLGLDLGEEGPISRGKAVEAMRFIRAATASKPSSSARTSSTASKRSWRWRARVSPSSLQGRVQDRGRDPDQGRASTPIDPLAPPVLPPQDVASPTLPRP